MTPEMQQREGFAHALQFLKYGHISWMNGSTVTVKVSHQLGQAGQPIAKVFYDSKNRKI